MPYTEFDLVNELTREYVEAYHEDPEIFNPDAYDELLDGMTTSELEEEYIRVFQLETEEDIDAHVNQLL